MRTVFAVVAGVVAMSAVYAAPDVEDGVLVLTDDNFDDAVAENENILVEFYAPWCGHCKKLAPEYAQAAGMLEKQDIDAKLAKVDATEAKELASRFEVQGFPTLKFFKGGKAREYKGPREAAGIAAWVKKNSGPAATTLDSAADVTKFVANGGDAVAVAYVHDVDGAKDAAAAAYLEAAANVDDVDFAIIADEEAANKAEVRAPAFVMYTEFDEGRSDYEGEEDDASAIEAWARGASLPTVVKFTPESAPKIFGGPVKTHFLVFSDDDETETHEAVLAQLTAVGKAHKGEILAIHVPPEEDRVMGYFEVTKDDLPAAVLVSMPADAPMKKFPFDGDVTEEGGLSGFAKKFLDGELKPVLKSEEVTPEDTEGDVVVVKGKSFADIVLAEDKDVLLEFYAPWCGHCKQLAPTYEKLGAKFADVEGVTIAKIDATANEVEHPGVNVRGFPTILFFPAGKGGADKKAVNFEGGRDLDSMVQFIEENATNEFELEEDDEGKDEL